MSEFLYDVKRLQWYHPQSLVTINDEDMPEELLPDTIEIKQ